jgi:parallel beta-helix repeat protein
MNKIVLLIVLSLLCITTAPQVHAATEKFGIISKNERWTAENSPYLITDDLLITENARVVVTPGVQIIVGKPISFVSGIPQRDYSDSFSISIKIQGAMKCVGRTDNRIIFSTRLSSVKQGEWYGLVITSKRDDEIEFAFCDFNGAYNALIIEQGAPLIRNCIIEFNNVGIQCIGESRPFIINCNIIHNFTTGIFIQKSNPLIMNNIIVSNKINGIWSDKVSQTTIEYNCFFNNPDGNIKGSNPELGILKRYSKKSKDSTDFAYNLFKDPVFAGTQADSMAIEHDVSLPTDRSHMKDTTLAKLLHDTLTDSTAAKWISRNYTRYALSPYSPCINAGKPGKEYNDMDGSRNDMGILGGQEFVDFKNK